MFSCFFQSGQQQTVRACDVLMCGSSDQAAISSFGMACYGLDQTFHEGGIYFQADLVTAYSCVVCKA
jgi:hypothetical protein